MYASQSICILLWIGSFVSKQILCCALSNQNIFELESFIKIGLKSLHSLVQPNRTNNC